MEEAWEPTAVPACAGASAGASAESKLQTPALGDRESRRGPGPVPSGSREAPDWAGLAGERTCSLPRPHTQCPFSGSFPDAGLCRVPSPAGQFVQRRDLMRSKSSLELRSGDTPGSFPGPCPGYWGPPGAPQCWSAVRSFQHVRVSQRLCHAAGTVLSCNAWGALGA